MSDYLWTPDATITDYPLKVPYRFLEDHALKELNITVGEAHEGFCRAKRDVEVLEIQLKETEPWRNSNRPSLQTLARLWVTSSHGDIIALIRSLRLAVCPFCQGQLAVRP